VGVALVTVIMRIVMLVGVMVVKLIPIQMRKIAASAIFRVALNKHVWEEVVLITQRVFVMMV
jgi:hypothetical protein